MPAISRHSTFYDILEALGQPGCAICTLVARTRWRYLDSLAYENVNDPGVRARLRQSLGFCNRHAWYFVETVREVFGAAIIYRDILHTVQRSTLGAAVSTGPEPIAPCPACTAEWQAADDALQVLTDALDEPDLRLAVEQSEGLCAPHLLYGLEQASADRQPAFRDRLLERWSSTSGSLAGHRWRAVGGPELFPTDRLALESAPPAPEVTLPPVPDDPFTCPICLATRRDLARFTSWNELDDGAGSLCNRHAWMPQGQDCQGLYGRQLDAVRDQLTQRDDALGNTWLHQTMRRLGRANRKLVLPRLPRRCVVCERQGATEAALASRDLYPLCLPHLSRAVRHLGPTAIDRTRPAWRELDQLLGEFLRKEDYRFRGEPRGIEQRSPRWIVALISGAPGIR